MGKNLFLDMNDIGNLAKVTKALGSEVRLEIINLLNTNSYNINEIAEKLGLAASTVAVNIKMLEEAGIIHTELQPGIRGSMKVCSKNTDELKINLNTNKDKSQENFYVVNMPIGNFSDCEAHPTCGMVSEKGNIIQEDYPRGFFSPMRHEAQLIWFHQGFLEYRFPNNLVKDAKAKKIEFSMEICSEAPNYRNNWPSDITISVNNKEIGMWTSPGDFGGRRGMYNPLWWSDGSTQYGLLKTIKVTSEGSYIDENKSSNITIEDLSIEPNDYISIRIEVKKDAKNVGGINIFGEKFGDFQQNIILRVDY
ncbi:ArsR/SmtB family transcription factor [Clostridium beijerinckii]|uniref:ArsR/SmtB family transcription factor n=1 Tax=Clostridium beijerinckii TaxID=1520 RepID=UPI000A72ACFD|nr:ArsR family transcriptional regulator [Clostridium beijerinckii]